MKEIYDEIAEYNDKNCARIILCGAGTVGQEVIKLAKQLQLYVVVLEDREEFAEIAKALGANQVICMPFDQGLDSLDARANDYYIVMTREHTYDKVCMDKIIDKPKAYVGMMASKNRGQILKEALINDGKDAARVNAIHSPIGLSIQAQTPAEIAVSIFSEIIHIKNNGTKVEGFSEELLNTIATNEGSSRMILATIIKRDGSAPRDVGTKMLIKEDGTKTGSVGGGWIEAQVLELARTMFDSNQATALYEADKDSQNAALCGGYETIYLEML